MKRRMPKSKPRLLGYADGGLVIGGMRRGRFAPVPDAPVGGTSGDEAAERRAAAEAATLATGNKGSAKRTRRMQAETESIQREDEEADTAPVDSSMRSTPFKRDI